jgi:hypothetical protein
MENKTLAIEKKDLRTIARSDVLILAIFFLFAFILIFLVNLPWSPRYYSMSVDNGIYALGGKLITQGQIPYLDYWDNIPPAINYINALTFILSGPTPWAVWWLNIIWLSITASLICAFVRKLAGFIPALLAVTFLIFLVMDGNLFSGGDMTEFFSLVPQILAVWALYNYLQFKQTRWVVVIGVLTALAFLTKQTAIGLGLSSIAVIVGIDLLKHDWRKAVKNSIIFLASFVALISLALSYWAINGALKDFFDQVILFNVFYTRGGISIDRLLLVMQTLVTERPFMYLVPLVIISYIVLILAYFKKAGTPVTRKQQESDTLLTPPKLTLLSAFLGLPIGIFFIATSVYNYFHYYTLLIPSVILILIFLISNIIKLINDHHKPAGFILGLMVIIVGSVWLVDSIRSELPKTDALASLTLPLYGDYPLDEMERYIVNHTEPGDPVLIWDMHTEIYFRTNTNAPSRFINPMPLLSANGNETSNFDLFMQDIVNHQPKLILTRGSNSSEVPYFDVPDERICPICLLEVQSGLRSFRSYVYAHYAIEKYINEWVIYKWIQ